MQKNNTSPIHSEEHVEWIDTTKCVTMILVIIGHCSYYNILSDYGGIHYISETDHISFVHKLLSLLVGFIYSFHMPLFMFVSGMCFSLGKVRMTLFWSLVVKKSKRLLLPFFVTTTFLSVPLKFLSGYYSESDNVSINIFLGQYLLMGNSHLWFVFALFGIFMLAYFLVINRLQEKKVYWPFLLFVSWIGLYGIIPPCLAINEMMRYLLFFMSGYTLYEILTHKNIGCTYVIVSWFAMAVFWYIYIWEQNHGIILPERLLKLVRYPFYTIFAFWGIFNMIFTCKVLARNNKIMCNPLYKYLNKNSYLLYLYSDPFNYVIIAVMSIVAGKVWESETLSLIAFILRAICTVILAGVVIAIVNKIKVNKLCK